MTIKEELKKEKLLWKGTTAEAIKLGKITQEEVDRWNMENEEGEKYTEGYNKAKEQAEKSFNEKIEKLKEYLKVFLQPEQVYEVLNVIDKEIFGENHSPSQQTSVDIREIVHTKKISDVGESPILDTNNKEIFKDVGGEK
jgi:hypothetical protein